MSILQENNNKNKNELATRIRHFFQCTENSNKNFNLSNSSSSSIELDDSFQQILCQKLPIKLKETIKFQSKETLVSSENKVVVITAEAKETSETVNKMNSDDEYQYFPRSSMLSAISERTNEFYDSLNTTSSKNSLNPIDNDSIEYARKTKYHLIRDSNNSKLNETLERVEYVEENGVFKLRKEEKVQVVENNNSSSDVDYNDNDVDDDKIITISSSENSFETADTDAVKNQRHSLSATDYFTADEINTIKKPIKQELNQSRTINDDKKSSGKYSLNVSTNIPSDSGEKSKLETSYETANAVSGSDSWSTKSECSSSIPLTISISSDVQSKSPINSHTTTSSSSTDYGIETYDEDYDNIDNNNHAADLHSFSSDDEYYSKRTHSPTTHSSSNEDAGSVPSLNDTLEQVEYLMKQGELLKQQQQQQQQEQQNKHEMCLKSPKTPSTPKTPNTVIAKMKTKQQPQHLPVSASKDLLFKIPPPLGFKKSPIITRIPQLIKKSTATTTTMTPTVSSKNSRFNHIVSPIAEYIKNGQTPLVHNVRNEIGFFDSSYCRELDFNETTISSADETFRDSTYVPALPRKGFISAENRKIYDERQNVIPGGDTVQKLIGNRPLVIKHEGRVNIGNKYEPDTLIDSSFADLSILPGDLSIQVVKNVERL